MFGPLESADEINKISDRLLRSADAYGRFPTPVDDILAAAKLVQTPEYVFDDSLIAKAPAWIRQTLRSAKHKIQGLVDRRERVVHIAPAIENEGKRRFVTLHETIHAATPHQQDLLYADNDETLSRTTNQLFEREANYGAAEVLFQRSYFTRDAKNLEISTDSVWLLAHQYGSSFHAALWRYAETHGHAVAAIVLGRTPVASNPSRWQRQMAVASPSWIDQFGTVAWPRSMSSLTYPFLAALDHVEVDEVRINNVRGERVDIQVSACQTPYNSFVLLSVPKRARIRRPVRVRVAS